jgi:biopolymer transport protein ExbD
MKFPRTAKIMRSRFDVAPFAAVFFTLLIFLLLAGLMPVPGLRMSLQPPSAADLPGVDGSPIAMAVDSQNRLYFENLMVSERQLTIDLRAAVSDAHEPLTLVIHADKAVSYEELAHLALLVRTPEIGITNLVLATLPRLVDSASQP